MVVECVYMFQVDPLKDAAGSPFSKTDKLHLHRMFRSCMCVKWGSTNTHWHIDVRYVQIFCTHIKCEVN